MALAGCGTVQAGAEGAEGGACRSDGTCDPALECASGICVAVLCSSVEDCPTAESTCTRPACDGNACQAIPVNDGHPCPRAGTVCTAGSCVTGCYIDGAFYEPDAVDPDDACLVCDPLSDREDWTDTCKIEIGCAEGGTCTLTVERSGDGEGTITSSPAGISCGETCSATFDFGETVTLSHAATSGTFNGWTGACSGAGSCAVVMTESRMVDARFSLLHNVTVCVDGLGLVEGSNISCTDCGGPGCSTVVPTGTLLTLEAITIGEPFQHWDGACADFFNNSSCTISITSPAFISAYFCEGPFNCPL